MNTEKLCLKVISNEDWLRVWNTRHVLKGAQEALVSGNVPQSAVAEHAGNEMRVIKWEEAELVNNHPHYHQRCVLEA